MDLRQILRKNGLEKKKTGLRRRSKNRMEKEKKKTGLRLRRHSGDTKTQAGHKGTGRRERLPTDISGGLKGTV